MEFKLNKDKGFLRLKICDETGRFVTYIHIANLQNETQVFIPDNTNNIEKVITVDSIENATT